jgi:lipoate-protein ligase A
MSFDIEELYDYDTLRQLQHPTMFSIRLGAPTIVLGGSQSDAILADAAGAVPLRRRRGGGGAVLLQPGDAWVDWWIPRDDPRWRVDIHECSYMVGEWWRIALSTVGVAATMHVGNVIDEPEHRVACFSGRGPGEIFIDNRKAVGLTQWRVREGMFLSTVFHASPSIDLLMFLREPAPTLGDALGHHQLDLLGLDAEDLVAQLRHLSAPESFRQLFLLA